MKRVSKAAIFVVSFVIAGIVDNFINERTFQTLNSVDIRSWPFSFYFIVYEIVFIAAGLAITYSLRKKLVDLLTLPAWLTGFDITSLISNGKQVFGQENWREIVWGYPAGVLGKLWLGIPIGYWISFALLAIYLVLLFGPNLRKKLKANLKI